MHLPVMETHYHVSIGEGAVVAAGAVVLKPVAPRTLVAGCPATVVRENVSPM
jgi:acetyltransferase-like isoleucine patch superfamily enzyme